MPRASTASRNFGVILYPDCLEHMDMLRYLEQYRYQFQIVYILHNNDVYEEDIEEHKKGDLKKPHYHVWVHCRNAKTLNGFLQFFKVWINYAEIISDTDSYIMYMLHCTPDSLHKHRYDASLLQGDANLIRKHVQTNNFVQLGELLDDIELNGGRMLTVLRKACNNERDDLFDLIKKYQSLLCTASNQEFRLFLENLK